MQHLRLSWANDARCEKNPLDVSATGTPRLAPQTAVQTMVEGRSCLSRVFTNTAACGGVCYSAEVESSTDGDVSSVGLDTPQCRAASLLLRREEKYNGKHSPELYSDINYIDLV